MILNDRIKVFVRLGEIFKLITEQKTPDSNLPDALQKSITALDSISRNFEQINPWFTTENIINSLKSWSLLLSETNLINWTNHYEFNDNTPSKRIGVIMAGNIPLVGFHDWLCVLISGHKFIGKQSGKDDKLLPAISEILINLAPEFANKIVFTDNKLNDIDAVIATGSNNSARYFEYYFSKMPNIIRKNRNSVAILSSSETDSDLDLLADDVFLYFGLGCRNVSKIFIHKNFDLQRLFNAFQKYEQIANHHPYFNNYEYNRAILLLNQEKFLDNGFVILKEHQSLASPISVVYYEYFEDTTQLTERLKPLSNEIQCIVSNITLNDIDIQPFGKAQYPELYDYADGVDTLKFLLSIK